MLTLNKPLPTSTSDSKRSDARRRALRLLFLVTLLALNVRLLWLGGKSLWLDEANSVRVAKLGQAELWAGHTEEYHPPLFYALLEYWLQFGESEANLRLPMAVAGVACVLLVYGFASALAGTEVALSAAAFTAFSPLLIWYSQELRPYSLLAALGLVGMLVLRRVLLRPQLGWWLLFALVSTATLYLHYATVLLFLLEALFVLALLAIGRATWEGAVLWLAGLLVAFVAMWPWFNTPGFGRFVAGELGNGGYIGNLLASYFNIRLDLSQVLGRLIIAGLIAGGALALALYPLIRRLYRGGTLEKLRASRAVQVVAVVLFVASLAGFVVPQAYSLKRQIVIVWPFALLVCGWLWPWQRRNYALTGILLALSLAAGLVNLALVPKDQWREAAAYIDAHFQANDLVMLEPQYMKIPFDYYHRGVESVGADYSAGDTLLPKLACAYDRIWLVDHQLDRDPLARTQHWLDARSAPAATTRFYRVEVRLYQLDHAAAQCAP